MLIGERFNSMEIARRYNLKDFILFNCTIPYDLKIDIDVYSTQISYLLSRDLNEQELVRKVIFAVTKRCINNQRVPSKSTYSFNTENGTYSTFITDIEIFVEVFNVDNIENLFDIKKIGLTEIFQNILTIFSSKYNESVSGQDFLNPTASEVGLQICKYISRNSIDGSYDVQNAIISPGFYLPQSENHRKEDFHKNIQEPYIMWRYFFNKAKYCFDTYDNLECILSSAISIEAYIQDKLNKHNLNEKLKQHIKDKEIKNISFFQITNFLKQNNIFNEENTNFINKIFGKISDMRNNIVHGKIVSPILSREKAEIAKMGIVELYSRLENLTLVMQDEPKLPLEYYFSKAFSYINKGYECIKQEKYEEAIEIFSNNIEKGIYLDYSYYNRGLCYFKTNNFQKSIDDFSICVNNKFYLLESLYNKSLSEVRINKNDQAIEDINLAIEIDNTQAKLYANKGLAYLNQCKYNEAINEFDISLEIEENEQVLYNKGVAYNRAGKLKEAFENFEKAISLKKETKYLYEVTLLYQKNKDYKNAIRLLNILVYRFPNNDEYLTIRGNCYISLKEYECAQRDFEECIKLRTDYYMGYMNLGVVYLNQQEYDKAYKYLMLALEKDKSNPSILRNLDILYINYALNEGKYINEAKKSIERLLIENPNDEKYVEIRKRLYEK